VPFFHVSRVYLGPRVILTPRQPGTAIHHERGLPDRVCFAPSVRRCLASLSGAGVSALVIGETVPRRKKVNGQWAHANPAVYQGPSRLRRPPQDRSDFASTGERWSLKPVEVEHVGFVCLRRLTRQGVVTLVRSPWSMADRLGQQYERWQDDFLPAKGGDWTNAGSVAK